MRSNPRRKFNLSLLLISFFAFITFALPVVRNSGSLVPWFAHAAGKPEAVPSQRRQRERRPCPTCAPPSPRRIYAPAIELPEAERCEIVLNSRSPNPIDVTPTFYTASGNTVGYSIPTCPPAFTATMTQTFVVVLGTQSYSLTSNNTISMGRTSSGSKFVNLTFTQ